MQTALFIDSSFKSHHVPAGHPERPERMDAVLAAFDRIDPEQKMLSLIHI